jgi:hypothetical protein
MFKVYTPSGLATDTALTTSSFSFTAYWDSASDTSSWTAYNSTDYELSMSASQLLGSHTLLLIVTATGYVQTETALYPYVIHHILSIVNWNSPSSILMSHSGLFEFNVNSDTPHQAYWTSFPSGGIVATLDSTPITFTYSSGYWQYTVASTSLSVGTHTMVIDVDEDYYLNVTQYTVSFIVTQNQLQIVMVSQPSSVYQPNSITFSFKVQNGSGGNYLNTPSVTSLLDALYNGNFTYSGGVYTTTFVSSSWYMIAGTHTLTIQASQQYYASSLVTSVSFGVLQFHLNLVNWQGSSIIYQSDTKTFTFQVENGSSGIFFSGVTVSAYLDKNTLVTFTYGSGAYSTNINSGSLGIGSHTFVITLSQTYYVSETVNETFSVADFTLDLGVTTNPVSVVYQPSGITICVTVENQTYGNYFSTATVKGQIDSGSSFTFSWVSASNDYEYSFASSSLSISTHSILVNATMAYFTTGYSSISFSVKDHILSIPSIFVTSAVYEPNLVSAYFNVVDENGNSFSNVTLSCYLDSTLVPNMFSWIGSEYYWSENSSSIGVGTHTIFVSVSLQYRTGVSASASFTVLIHHYEVHWKTPIPSSVYKPNTITFAFNVSDELGNYFNNAPMTNRIDNTQVSFVWNGSQFVYTVQSTQWLEGWHTLFVNVGSSYYSSVNDTEAFDVEMHTLSIVWLTESLIVYQPHSANFSFKVVDELGNTYAVGQLTSLTNNLDLIYSETITYNNPYYNITIPYSGPLGGQLVLGYHTLTLNANLEYYHNATASDTFLVSWYNLKISNWTGAATWYYPTDYVANFTVSNELGVVKADLVTFTMDGFSESNLTYYGNGLYGLDIPVQVLGVNIWGIGSHAVAISVSKLGMNPGNKTYYFNLEYRPISIVYTGQSPLQYNYSNYNYTFRVALNSYITLGTLSWSMTVDGNTVQTSSYTSVGCVYVYTLANLTSGTHTVILDVKSSNKNIQETTDTVYVSLIAPNELLPVIPKGFTPSSSVELWGSYTVQFFIEDSSGNIIKGAFVVVSVYDSTTGLEITSSSPLTPDSTGLYTYSVSPSQIGGLGTYTLKVYIADNNYQRTDAVLSSFSISDLGETIISAILAGWSILWDVLGGFQVVQERQLKQLSEKVKKRGTFEIFTVRRFLYPFIGSSVGVFAMAVEMLWIYGLQLLSSLLIVSGIIFVAISLLVYYGTQHYAVNTLLGGLGMVAVIGSVYYAIPYGMLWFIVGIVGLSVAWLGYFMVLSVSYLVGEDNKFFNELQSGIGQVVNV